MSCIDFSHSADPRVSSTGASTLHQLNSALNTWKIKLRRIRRISCSYSISVQVPTRQFRRGFMAHRYILSVPYLRRAFLRPLQVTSDEIGRLTVIQEEQYSLIDTLRAKDRVGSKRASELDFEELIATGTECYELSFRVGVARPPERTLAAPHQPLLQGAASRILRGRLKTEDH
ncbi:hypothetical protein TSAR_005072 [Trichomalopsis sarcophagae]|uniref:Uncharacterized protein n=1 Tax=Trichomalopsis sarcophagae TaxID=543379 RepID=A0A232EM15_9HYME|nr:hypothetical protein TSAR_005072 [Trichomalopsis sarcophagae]